MTDYTVNMTDTLNTNIEMPRAARFHFIKNGQHFQHASSATAYFKLGGLIHYLLFWCKPFNAIFVDLFIVSKIKDTNISPYSQKFGLGGSKSNISNCMR